MSDLVVELSQQAQKLRPADRARLAELLLDSIRQSADGGVEAAWDTELMRRIHEIEQGVATLVSADAAFDQVRRAIRWLIRSAGGNMRISNRYLTPTSEAFPTRFALRCRANQ